MSKMWFHCFVATKLFFKKRMIPQYLKLASYSPFILKSWLFKVSVVPPEWKPITDVLLILLHLFTVGLFVCIASLFLIVFPFRCVSQQMKLRLFVCFSKATINLLWTGQLSQMLKWMTHFWILFTVTRDNHGHRFQTTRTNNFLSTKSS